MQENNLERQRTPRMSVSEKGHFFKVRNVLNIIFMLLVVVGALLYFLVSHQVGTIIILIAIVIKVVETILRLFH